MKEYQVHKTQLTNQYSESLPGLFGNFNDLAVKDELQRIKLQLTSGLERNSTTRRALMLMFVHRHEDKELYYALVITPESCQLVPLLSLSDSLPDVSVGLGMRDVTGFRLGQCGLDSVFDRVPNEISKVVKRESDVGSDRKFDITPHTIADDSILQENLWSVLVPYIEGFNSLHIVTQGQMHLLPYEATCPEHIELEVYPGLVFYQQRADFPIKPPNHNSTLGIHTHAAFETESPIPMVESEAALVSQLWPGKSVSILDDDSELDENLDCVLLCTHGHHNEENATLSGLVLGNDNVLDFSKALVKKCWPPVVFLSACLVGRITEDQDGDPLGLMSALFMRGTRVIVASVQPVADLIMPMLSGFFFRCMENASMYSSHGDENCQAGITLR